MRSLRRGHRRSTDHAHAGGGSLETLEPRIVLSSFVWTPEEVLLAELVNRARMDPIAEGQRVGLDLSIGLTDAELARLLPQEPLALNAELTIAARGHNADMAARGFFAHENPDGIDPSGRAEDAGYSSGAGENIAAGQADVTAAHIAWLDSLGHRLNVLSLHDNFTSSFHYNEIGTASLGRVPGAEYRSYFGQLFGVARGTFILGVVTEDLDQDNFYDVGEGRGGVLVEVRRSGRDEIVASYTTGDAGNYQIEVPSNGDYTVTFTSPETGFVKVSEVKVTGENVKLDAETGELIERPDVDADVNVASAPTSYFAPDGTLSVGLVNGDGHAIVTRKAPGGGWIADDLSERTGVTGVIGDVHTWFDTRDGRHYAVAPTATGLTLFTLTGSQWTARDLSGELGVGVVLPDLTVFTGLDRLTRVAATTAEGDLLLFQQTTGVGPTSDGGSGFGWIARNLSDVDLAANGQLTPRFQGELVSYVTPWGGLNIAGLDDTGAIHAVWWAPGLQRWRTDNLSAITGAPEMTGGLTVNQTSWSGINIIGIDSAGRVQTTWWVPSFGADWRTDDLTANAGGPSLVASGASSFTTSWDGINIAGQDENGHVVVYWWAPGLSKWAVAPLTTVVDGAPSIRGDIRGGSSSLGEMSLVSASDAGELVRLYWTPGAAWASESITEQV